ncbi:hypothetical protein D3C75_1216860 [compost metagenome]
MRRASSSFCSRDSTFSTIRSDPVLPLMTSRARRISGCRRATSATCDGCTNMPRTLVVWSARPIHPLMRVLVRPHGEMPDITADRSPVPNRTSG